MNKPETIKCPCSRNKAIDMIISNKRKHQCGLLCRDKECEQLCLLLKSINESVGSIVTYFSFEELRKKDDAERDSINGGGDDVFWAVFNDDLKIKRRFWSLCELCRPNNITIDTKGVVYHQNGLKAVTDIRVKGSYYGKTFHFTDVNPF